MGEAAFDGFWRKFPAISAIYFAQDHANDIDKRLQGCTGLVGFLIVTVGRWKEPLDVSNDLVTENEGPFISCTDGHAAAPLTVLLHQAANLQCDKFGAVEAANRRRLVRRVLRPQAASLTDLPSEAEELGDRKSTRLNSSHT